MGGKEDKFDKFDKFDEYGQLAGGFDVNLAREAAVKHAREQLSNEKNWLRGVKLEWEIDSARFDEDEDCYKVILLCYPEDVEIEEKAQWEYHIDALGNLYAGTPKLISKGKWKTTRQPESKTKFCTYCGRDNVFGATFCRSCGKEMPVTREEEEEKRLAEERKRREAEEAERKRIEEERRQAEERKRREAEEAERKRIEAERKRQAEEERRQDAAEQVERERVPTVAAAPERGETPGSRKPLLIVMGILIIIAAIIVPVILLSGGSDEGKNEVAIPPVTTAPPATTAKPTPTTTPSPTKTMASSPTPSPTPAPPKSTTLSMVSIPGGSFQMGDLSGDGAIDEKPVHTVTLSPFQMARYEVSYAQWQEVKNWAGSHGYSFDNSGGKGYGSGADENHPVTDINWYDAAKWCNALSEMEGRTPCYYTSSAQTTVYRSGQIGIKNEWVDWDADGYRLPTEAEWEYACRANTTTKYSFGNSIDSGDANYDSHEGGTVEVGSYSPNNWGLYDMHGNVYEWCWDWYDDYSSSSQTDPRGPSVGSYRGLRGGSWYYNAGILRSAFRNYGLPGLGYDDFGFRPVRSSS